ncbi:hypothetical protein MLD38_026546 [Melastoma candidum]|uniref:Uncharacterized protein n=1 Tax=Melastoma candidum TaxID=119954 RepID=A0ACB9P2G9_9MYRT|nr:hypothetical protein MLD38_026546 [Melastoma candidum]
MQSYSPSLGPVNQEMKSLIMLSAPVMTTSLLIYCRTLVSLLFATWLGKTELSGTLLAFTLANVTGYSVVRGLSMGMDPICSQAFGAKRFHVVVQTYQKGLSLVSVACVPLSILWLKIGPLLLAVGQNPEVAKVTGVFMASLIPELFAQSVLQTTRTFLRSQGLTMPATVSSLFATILHLPINYFLVIHLNLGIRGVAVGIIWSTVIMDLGLFIYILFSDQSLKPWHGWCLFSREVQDQKTLQQLLSLAVSSCIALCLDWWCYGIMLLLSSFLVNSEVNIAAMGIILHTTGFFYAILFSLSSGLSTLIGHALGAGEPGRARNTSGVGIAISAAFGLLVFVSLTALRSIQGKMYTDDPQIRGLVYLGLPIMGLCEVANAPQTAMAGILAGAACPQKSARIKLCSFYLIGIPAAITLAFKQGLGLRGILVGLLASQISCVVLMGNALMKMDWKQQAKRAQELTVGTSSSAKDD